jgi:methyl-accepting chemotaxis protein
MSVRQTVKRRKYFIKDVSQMRLIMKVYFILLFTMFISNTIFYFIGNKELTESYFQAHLAIRQTMDILLPAIIIVSALGLLSAFVIVLLFTHRIVGPVYRMRLLANKIKDGDFTTKVSFRAKDELKELEGIMNDTLEKLGNKVSEVQKELDDIISSLTDLSKNSLKSEVNYKIKGILNKLKSLNEKTAQFKC